MNQEIKEEWCRRLRSGEYKQAQAALTLLNDKGEVIGHCCLGVLMEMAVEAGVTYVDPRPKSIDIRYYTDTPGGPLFYASTLTSAVVAWAGLKQGNPFIGLRDGDGLVGIMNQRNREMQFDNLAVANDAAKLSFSKIADIIEEAL
jgi:hypothetical protein